MEAGSSSFSNEFCRQLALGKYTKWAVNLTEAQLGGLLWMVGEFGIRFWGLSGRLKLDSLWGRWGGYGRTRLALESISRMVLYGERFDLEGARARTRRGRAHLTFHDLPETVQAAADASSTKTRRDSVMKSADGFKLEGVNKEGRAIGLSISNGGQVLEKTPLAAGRGPFSSLAKTKTLASLIEQPPFEGQLRIDLIEERLGDSFRHVLDCRKRPPFFPSELIFFTASLPWC